MNRFDDAVLDLMAHLPPDPDMASLRKRARQHRRRRSVATLAVIGVMSVVSISVAASLGRKSSAPVVAVSPTTALRLITTTTTTTAFADDECGAGQTGTLTAWDHATLRPIQVNRAYYCRRVEELNPPTDSHLTGTIYVSDGKVLATYYRLKDVVTVRNGIPVDTGVSGTDPVPVDQLPARLRDALAAPESTP